MTTGWDGAVNVRVARPSFTETKKLPTEPSLPTTSFSVVNPGFAFSQYGSAPSLMGAGAGAVPVNVTFPVTVAAIAGSTAGEVAVGAAAPEPAGADAC